MAMTPEEKIMNPVFHLLMSFFIIIGAYSLKAGSGDFFEKVRKGHIRSADDTLWKQVGPGESGTAMSLFVHPTKKEIVFMCNDMGSSYRSTDGGKSWESIIDCDGDCITGSQFEGMDFSLTEPQKGFGVSNRGLSRTEDYGKTWKQIQHNFGQLSSVAISPYDSNIVFAGSGLKHLATCMLPNKNTGKIYRSLDGGKIWEKRSKGISSDAVIIKILFSRNNDKKVFAATTSGFYASEDKGESWKRYDKGLLHSNCRGLDYSFDKESGKMILFLLLWTDIKIKDNTPEYSGGLYKSFDSGKTWKKISLQNLRFDINKMSDFVKWDFTKSLARSLKISFKEAEKIALPTSALQRFHNIFVDKKNPDIMYLGVLGWNYRHSFDPYGIWKSIDGGKTWNMTTRRGKGWHDPYWKEREQLASENVDSGWLKHKKAIADIEYNQFDTRGMAVSPINSDILYFSTVHAVYKSFDGGKTWKNTDTVQLGPNRWKGNGNSNVSTYSVYIDPRTPDNILLAAADICLIRSHDGGKSFSLTNQTVGDGTAIAFDPDNPDIVYLGKSRGVPGDFMISRDKGETFKKLSILPNRAPVNSIAIAPDSPENNRRIIVCSSLVRGKIIFKAAMGTGNGIFVSEDGGKTWKKSNKGLGPNLNVIDIKQHSNNHKIIYAVLVMRKLNNGTLQKGGIFKSMDSGKTWNKVKIPEEIYNVTSIHIDKTNPDTIYFSAGQALDFPFKHNHMISGGVFRSPDGGKTWKKIFSSPFCSFVTSHPEKPEVIYVANSDVWSQNTTNNPGIFRSLDSGRSWEKINRGIANPHLIHSIKFHPCDPSIVWLATHSSGWYVNKYKTFEKSTGR